MEKETPPAPKSTSNDKTALLTKELSKQVALQKQEQKTIDKLEQDRVD